MDICPFKKCKYNTGVNCEIYPNPELCETYHIIKDDEVNVTFRVIQEEKPTEQKCPHYDSSDNCEYWARQGNTERCKDVDIKTCLYKLGIKAGQDSRQPEIEALENLG